MRPFLSFCVAGLCLFSLSAAAQPPQKDGFCLNATDTAQTISCLNKELTFRQTALNDAYNTLITEAKENEDTIAALKATQNSWLAYRDAECSREKSWRSGQALSRVYELSCLSQLTRNRLQRLKRGRDAKDDNTPPEFTPYARWQTLIIKNYPKTYWGFTKSASFDSNCDNTVDSITPGLRFIDHDKEQAQQAVFAIAHLKETGRPDIHIFESDALTGQCLSQYTIDDTKGHIELSDNHNDPEDTNNPQNKECHLYINFANPECPSLTLEWNEEEGVYKNIEPLIMSQPNDKK